MSSPKSSTLPSSGRSSPMMSLSSTLLPTPAGPSRMRVSAGRNREADVFEDRRAVEGQGDVAHGDDRAGLRRRRQAVAARNGGVAHAGKQGEQDVGDEEVDKDDEHRGVDHGRNGGAAHALGAAGGSHAVEAADGGNDVAEEERLDQSLEDIGISAGVPMPCEKYCVPFWWLRKTVTAAPPDDAECVGHDGEKEQHDRWWRRCAA